ncbi:hypothetical protein SS50377_28277 [Spironucleus salmonicida]|nr:hypothetical protein SS50377_28277 [Spironucleus salmonicida]
MLTDLQIQQNLSISNDIITCILNQSMEKLQQVTTNLVDEPQFNNLFFNKILKFTQFEPLQQQIIDVSNILQFIHQNSLTFVSEFSVTQIQAHLYSLISSQEITNFADLRQLKSCTVIQLLSPLHQKLINISIEDKFLHLYLNSENLFLTKFDQFDTRDDFAFIQKSTYTQQEYFDVRFKENKSQTAVFTLNNLEFQLTQTALKIATLLHQRRNHLLHNRDLHAFPQLIQAKILDPKVLETYFLSAKTQLAASPNPKHIAAAMQNAEFLALAAHDLVALAGRESAEFARRCEEFSAEIARVLRANFEATAEDAFKTALNGCLADGAVFEPGFARALEPARRREIAAPVLEFVGTAHVVLGFFSGSSLWVQVIQRDLYAQFLGVFGSMFSRFVARRGKKMAEVNEQNFVQNKKDLCRLVLGELQSAVLAKNPFKEGDLQLLMDNFEKSVDF